MSIYVKLQSVQEEIKELIRNEKNEFQKYFFFNEFQILNLLKPLLAKYKISIIISDDNSSSNFFYEKTEKEHVIRYLKKVQLIDVESDFLEKKIELSFWAMGQNTDIAKAKGSAETYAAKHILSKLFLIPVKNLDDPDYVEPAINEGRKIVERKDDRIEGFLKKHGIIK